MTPLHILIATYITSQDSPVSLTTIYTRAKGRFTDEDVRKAMSIIHKTRRDIKVTVKEDTCWYSKRTQSPPKPQPERTHETPEERAERKRQVDDFIDNSILFTDEERECLRTPFKDRSDRCHQLCDTPAGYNRTMVNKYGTYQWRRMCEIV